MKAPWLTQILAPGTRVGVPELAAREATLREVELKDIESGLHFIGQSPTGRRRFPPKLEDVRAMLADLRAQHDVVVLDLPPLQASSAAIRLSQLVDGFVLVTRWGNTPQPLLSETLARTAAVDALFLGVVLNRCAPRRMRLYANPAHLPVARLPVAVTSDV
jgi:receptor protein-tyrosine kinase